MTERINTLTKKAITPKHIIYVVIAIVVVVACAYGYGLLPP